jgi:hypothetical protein
MNKQNYFPVFLLTVFTLIVANRDSFTNLKFDFTNATATATQTVTGGFITQTPTGTSGTPSQTFTPSVTPTPSATTTLMPLPAITLIFPVKTGTPSPTKTPIPVITTETVEASEGGKFINSSPRMRLLAIILVFLWVILAGFLIVFIRQFK